jgi:hypothetical protein
MGPSYVRAATKLRGGKPLRITDVFFLATSLLTCVSTFVIITRHKAMHVSRNVEARSRNHCCREKQSVLHSLCVYVCACTCMCVCVCVSVCLSVALFSQHAKRMRSIILCSVACQALKYFSTLSHKRQIFEKRLLNIKCVF